MTFSQQARAHSDGTGLNARVKVYVCHTNAFEARALATMREHGVRSANSFSEDRRPEATVKVDARYERRAKTLAPAYSHP